MKNKQVKQMMKDVFFIDYAEYRSVISIKAMDHWLFLSKQKVEKFFPEQIVIGGGGSEFDVNPVSNKYVLDAVIENNRDV